MQNKDIIIELIKQHMRFNQYIAALRNAGIEVYEFDLDLMAIVAILMGVKGEDMSDTWMELYSAALIKCENVPIEPLGNNLYSLAEGCYEGLVGFRVR